jgi:general stress protein YciG
MAGSKEGSKKAVQTIYQKHGKDFFKVQGKIGGAIGRTGGFYADRELASRVGRIGGLISRKDTPLNEEQRRAILNRMENA